MSDELVTWLRRQVEDDLSIARLISQGGFEPQRWDTEPPGQLNPAHDPASAAISKAIGQEPEYSCGWVQIVVYEREIGDPPEEEYREPGSVAALAEIGRREFDHIVRHDPRSVVADCEAKLAILDEHYILWAAGSGVSNPEQYDEFSVVPVGGANKDHGCVRCHYYGMGGVKGYGYCRTVKILASGYRFRPGYREEWKP